MNPENNTNTNDDTVTRTLNFVITDNEDNSIENAVVTIGTSTGTTGSAGGCTVSNIADGEHEITVEADGYVTLTDTITVSENNTAFTFKLTAV